MNLPTFTLEQLLILYVVNQVASALVQAAPIPVEGGNQFYAFIYKFFTLLVGDFKSFMTKLPALGTVQVTAPSGAVTTTPSVPPPDSVTVTTTSTEPLGKQ